MAIKYKILLGMIFAVLLVFAGCSVEENQISSFEECVEAGFPVMESYPEQCSDGVNTFVKEYPDENLSENMQDEDSQIIELNEDKEPNYTYQTYCEENGGEWNEEFNECLGIDENTCVDGGGEFNPCASACRNEPDAQVCTMQCVIVCDFYSNNSNNDENIGDESRSDSNGLEVIDAYGNVVDGGCSSWFDGCNNCNVGEDGSLGCTRKYCGQESLEEPSCLSYE